MRILGEGGRDGSKGTVGAIGARARRRGRGNGGKYEVTGAPLGRKASRAALGRAVRKDRKLNTGRKGGQRGERRSAIGGRWECGAQRCHLSVAME